LNDLLVVETSLAERLLQPKQTSIIHPAVTTSCPPICSTLQVMGRSILNFRTKMYMTQQSEQ
jgi:hypothetical protein